MAASHREVLSLATARPSDFFSEDVDFVGAKNDVLAENNLLGNAHSVLGKVPQKCANSEFKPSS